MQRGIRKAPDFGQHTEKVGVATEVQSKARRGESRPEVALFLQLGGWNICPYLDCALRKRKAVVDGSCGGGKKGHAGL